MRDRLQTLQQSLVNNEPDWQLLSALYACFPKLVEWPFKDSKMEAHYQLDPSRKRYLNFEPILSTTFGLSPSDKSRKDAMFPDSKTIPMKNRTKSFVVNVGKSITGQRLTSVVINTLEAQLGKLWLVEKSCLFYKLDKRYFYKTLSRTEAVVSSRACVSSMNALSGRKFFSKNSTHCTSKAGTAYFFAV